MIMIHRLLNTPLSNSFFLFGPRGTGKTSYVKALLVGKEHVTIDLLDQNVFSTLQAYPEELQRFINTQTEKKGIVFIDEVQKVPSLLDVVHRNIEKHHLCFILSGSSARKLRRGSANLLAGRAFTFQLFPLLEKELGETFDLERSLHWGLLPKIWSLHDPLERSLFLQAYTETYIREEIVAEQVIRKLPPFRRFLQVAAQCNSQVINYANIAADASTDPSNVRNYYQVLEDTLLGFFLEPFHLSIRKRQRLSPKFYFFDTGVVRALQQNLDIPVRQGSYEYGRLFETFLILQIQALLKYSNRQFQLSYLLTKDKAEVDVIIERAGEPRYFVEIKSGVSVRDEDLRSLRRLTQEVSGARPICLYNGTTRLRSQDVDILPWREGLLEMGL